MKTWGTSLFAVLSTSLFACGGAAPPANAPTSSTTTTAAEPKQSAPVEEATPAAVPTPVEAPAADEAKAEACPQDWVCANVALDTGKVTKRETKLIGDPKIDSTWSKNVDTRAPASFTEASKPVDVVLRLPQAKPGEHLAHVVLKLRGREILLDKHTGEEVTYVGVIAAEKDGQFMIDLRYMK